MGIDSEADAAGFVGGLRSVPAPFEAWVLPHLRPLSAVASRLVGSDDAADVVQETLLRAWRKWDTYSAVRGEPRAWLIAILLDQVRRYRVRHLWRWRRALPSGDEAVVLYYFADLSVSEVGAAMSISAGTVKAHLAAARSRLRDLLEAP